MTLIEFRRQLGLSQAALAARLTSLGFPTTQGLVSGWERGDIAVTAERAVQIEQVTAGLVTRLELRPDLFGPIEAAASADPAASGAEAA